MYAFFSVVNNYKVPSAVADPGFPRGGNNGRSRISRGNANHWIYGKNLLFGKIFAENCMKMKEIGRRRGYVPSDTPTGTSTIEETTCYYLPANDVLEGNLSVVCVCLSRMRNPIHTLPKPPLCTEPCPPYRTSEPQPQGHVETRSIWTSLYMGPWDNPTIFFYIRGSRNQ